MLLATAPVTVPAIVMDVGFLRGWNAPWAAWVPVCGTAFWTVGLPLLWPHALGGAIMVFSIAFRELVDSVLLRLP